MRSSTAAHRRPTKASRTFGEIREAGGDRGKWSRRGRRLARDAQARRATSRLNHLEARIAVDDDLAAIIRCGPATPAREVRRDRSGQS
jgi:hypothetical protein